MVYKALSNLSNFSSRLLRPQIPPSEVTSNSTPLVEFTLSCAGLILMILLKALPSQSIAARGAKRERCSGGHNPAMNSSFFVYSLISVSPGLNAGIMLHGRWDKDDVEPDVEPDDTCSPVPVSITPDLQLPARSFPRPAAVAPLPMWLPTKVAKPPS